jgi:hypothetical protein
LREPDPAETEASAVIEADELLAGAPLDANYLSFEELRVISRTLRKIVTEEAPDEDPEEIMLAVDQITLTLQEIMRRKERGQSMKLMI